MEDADRLELRDQILRNGSVKKTPWYADWCRKSKEQWRRQTFEEVLAAELGVVLPFGTPTAEDTRKEILVECGRAFYDMKPAFLPMRDKHYHAIYFETELPTMRRACAKAWSKYRGKHDVAVGPEPHEDVPTLIIIKA